jgi:hypothetical protein
MRARRRHPTIELERLPGVVPVRQGAAPGRVDRATDAHTKEEHVITATPATVVRAPAAERHGAFVRDVLGQYAAARRLAPLPSRGLSPQEARFGAGPAAPAAFEHSPQLGAVRLFNLLPAATLERAVLVEALAVCLDLPEAAVDFVDVRPRDSAPIEHGAVCLRSPVFLAAGGTHWRLFLTLTHDAVWRTPEGEFHGDVRTERFIASVSL